MQWKVLHYQCKQIQFQKQTIVSLPYLISKLPYLIYKAGELLWSPKEITASMIYWKVQNKVNLQSRAQSASSEWILMK